MLQTLKMLVVNYLVVWNLNFLHRIHRHFWIKLLHKLGVKTALGTNDSFNDSMRVNKSFVADSPKKVISSGKKCNMFSKFWMAPLVRNFNKFSSEKKTCFSLCQEVASPSLSVVSHNKNLLISVSSEWRPVCCTFCNNLSEQCPFSVSLPSSQQLFWCSCQCWYYISKMNPVFSMIFHTNTITFTYA